MTLTAPGHSERFDRQAAEYAFPYHWLPSTDERDAAIGRTLSWGLEYLAVLETTAELVAATNPARVLDFGCGDGRLAVELARRGVPEVVGVDLVEQAIAFARVFGAPIASQLRFECLRVQDFDAGTFDTAVMMEVLEHIPGAELDSVIGALWRRVRADGALIVSVPTTNVPQNAKHERHYTEELLRSHLGARFEVDSVRYVHRASAANGMLRRMLTNRLVSLEEPHLRRFVTALYRRTGWHAGSSDGAHLLALCRRA